MKKPDREIPEGLRRLMEDTTLKTLAARMRAAREWHGWTQKELGVRAKTTEGRVAKVERGKSLRPRNIEQYGEALGTGAPWLQYGTAATTGMSCEDFETLSEFKELSPENRQLIKQMIKSLK